jgi:hypothetical protein
VPYPNHDWDFRGCLNNVATVDQYSNGDQPPTYTSATALNGALCSPTGLILDGIGAYAAISSWGAWGGSVSFEVYVQFSSFKMNGRIFDFDNAGGSSAAVFLGNMDLSPDLYFAARSDRQGNTPGDQLKPSSYWPATGANDQIAVSTWVHAVVAVNDSQLVTYLNGDIFAVVASNQRPLTASRSSNWIGRSNVLSDPYFAGQVAYVRTWNGVSLAASDASTLWQYRLECAAGRYGSGNGSCVQCAQGTFALNRGMSACTPCPAGEHLRFFGARRLSTCY